MAALRQECNMNIIKWKFYFLHSLWYYICSALIWYFAIFFPDSWKLKWIGRTFWLHIKFTASAQVKPEHRVSQAIHPREKLIAISSPCKNQACRKTSEPIIKSLWHPRRVFAWDGEKASRWRPSFFPLYLPWWCVHHQHRFCLPSAVTLQRAVGTHLICISDVSAHQHRERADLQANRRRGDVFSGQKGCARCSLSPVQTLFMQQSETRPFLPSFAPSQCASQMFSDAWLRECVSHTRANLHDTRDGPHLGNKCCT